MAIEKAGWGRFLKGDSVVHTLPSHDIIEHRKRFTCLCNPKVLAGFDQSEQVVWNVIHNSFDEYLDDDDVEPYKGI